MRLHYIILIALPWCILLDIHSQNKVTSIVLDEKMIPIPYATVYNNNTHRGAITNEEGRFTLIAQPSDVIIIRCLGYHEYKNTAEKLQNSGRVVLKEAFYELNEVIVTPKKDDAKSIIKKFHANIRKNYPTKATLINGVYKEYSLIGNEYCNFSQYDIDLMLESIASRSRPDYHIKVHDHTSFRHSNFTNDENEICRMESDAYFMKLWLYWCSFLWDFKKYQYWYAGFTTYNESEIAIIKFSPKHPKINIRRYTGVMYIDLKTYALVFVNSEIMQPYDMDFIFYKGLWQKTKKSEVKIMFEFSDGFYYPAFMINKATMSLNVSKGILTVDYIFNFFTKQIDFDPMSFVSDSIPLEKFNINGVLERSKDYKSDFILETEKEKQFFNYLK